MCYSNTNEHLYDDIAIWEKTEGIDFFKEMPLNDNDMPQILDFGYGFGQYMFAAAYTFPNGTIYGIERNPICVKEVSDKIQVRKLININLITEDATNFAHFEDNSLDLVLLYDTLHADYENKKMLLQESWRVLKNGGCLSVLPFHLSNWRDKDNNKKKYSIAKSKAEIEEFNFKYVGTCQTKGVHWEKCHTLYYIQKGTITINMLERMNVMNFIKE